MSQILDAYRGLKLRDRIGAAPSWARKIGLLLVIAFAFYLPFLNILPFAYIRTDLTSRGSDWASVLFLVVVYMIVAVGLNVVIGFAGLLDLGYVVETLETSHTWSRLDELYRGVGGALAGAMAAQGTEGIVMCHVSHAYRDGASLYFTFACPARQGAELEQWRAVKTAA